MGAGLARWFTSLLLPKAPPPLPIGVLAIIAIVSLETVVVRLLEMVSADNPPKASVYMLGVLSITIAWGAPLGLIAALFSVVAFNYFYVQPVGIHLTGFEDLVRLLLFAAVVLLGSGLAGVARANAEEAQRRAADAETVARLTHIFLGHDLGSGLRAASLHLADRFGLSSATLELADAESPAPRPDVIDITVCDEATAVARLRLPDHTPPATCQRLRLRIVGPLGTILHTAVEREGLLTSLRASRERTEALLAEQTALRRVAVLVAGGSPPNRVFAAVTAELHQLFAGCRTALVRYGRSGDLLVVSERDEHGHLMPGDGHQPVSEEGIVATVARTGHAAQVDYDGLSGPIGQRMHELGVRRGAGVPIVVDGHLWGVTLVMSYQPVPFPPDAEARLAAFTELVATSIAIAENRAALAASRSRLVTAADDARRRIERDLHDGAQQRIISLALQLRLAHDTVPDLAAARQLLSGAVQALTEIHQNLSDLARGIHPALLAQGGVEPVLRMLARRSAVPCELHARLRGRLPEAVEVAVYYVVSEALTNIAKHARAALAVVTVVADEACVRVTVSDDGVGGADPAVGTGLVGLRDRVEALGGHLSVVSPPGRGTALHAELPLTGPGLVMVRHPGDAAAPDRTTAAYQV